MFEFELYRVVRVRYNPNTEDFEFIPTSVVKDTREIAEKAALKLSGIPIIAGDDTFTVEEG